MTEETMTTTRFTQLPMEWVTGVTRERIMYEICWYMWKLTPAITTSGRICTDAEQSKSGLEKKICAESVCGARTTLKSAP